MYLPCFKIWEGELMGFYNPRPESNFIVDKVLKWITDIIVFVAVAVFFVIYLGEETSIVGSSMAPAIDDGQVILIDRMSYEITSPGRFDVIVYKSKTTENQYVIKRIIGLPGETVKIEDSKIYINGEVLEDKYFDGTYESGYAQNEIKVGNNQYFVMGDNRNLSEDSRFEYIGNISEENIIGKAWLIASPFKEIGFID